MKCKCGCGQEFTPSEATLWRIKQGQDSGYIAGHQGRRERNPRWQGGRFICDQGYVYLLRPDHPNALKKGYVGYIAEHRLVMCEYLGRALEANELVHHRNGERADNRLENLVLITRAAHASHHCKGEKSGSWKGGRKPIVCATCGKSFLPEDRRNDYGAQYCSRQCFYDRNRHRH